MVTTYTKRTPAEIVDEVLLVLDGGRGLGGVEVVEVHGVCVGVSISAALSVSRATVLDTMRSTYEFGG